MLLVSHAQPAIFWKKYGIADGLPDLHINCITQDHDGYIWIGTDAGLVRFDGHVFKVWQYDPLNENGLQGNIVEKICIYKSTLWFVVHNKGLHTLDLQTHIATSLKDILPLYEISDIAVVNDNIFVLNASTVYCVSPNNKSYQPFISPNHGEGELNTITAMNDSSLLIGGITTGAFKASFNDKKPLGEIRGLQHLQKLYREGMNYTISECLYDSDNMYMGAWDNALHSLQGHDTMFVSYIFDDTHTISYNSDEITVLEHYNAGQLWIGTKKGDFLSFDKTTKQFTSLHFKGIENNSYTSLLRDKEHGFWLGTESGLYYCHPDNQLFHTHTLPNAGNVPVNRIFVKEQLVYIGTDKGLYVHHMQNNTIGHYFPEMEIHALSNAPSGDIAIGTSTALYDFHPIQKTLYPLLQGKLIKVPSHYFYPEKIDFSRYNNITYWKKDTLFLAVAYGHHVVFYDHREKYYSAYMHLNDIAHNEHLINKIHVNKSGQLIVLGSEYGIHFDMYESIKECEDDPGYLRFNRKDKADYPYLDLYARKTFNQSTHPVLQSNTFYDILEVSPAEYWLASRSGLYHFKPYDSSPFEKIDVPIHHIEGINMDSAKNLWMVGGGGLLYYNIPTETYRFFNEEDGLPAGGVHGYLEKDKNGALYVSGLGCYVSFSPKRLLMQKANYKPLQITAFRIHTKKAKTVDIHQPVVIHESENIFSISFTAQPYKNNKSVQYEYSIPDISDQWIDNGNSNEILITGLTADDYTIHIRAKDKNNNLISNIGKVYVKIRPYWHNTWLFRIGLLCLVFYLTYLFFQFLQRQRAKVQYIRNDIARDLHDDIGSTLGSISIYSEAASLRLEAGNEKEASEILSKIGSNSRQMIDKMSDIVWSVNSEKDSLFDLFEKMEIFARNVFSVRDMQFTYTLSSNISNRKIDMIERKNIYLIFKEMVHNIIKHSDASIVQMSVYRSDGKIHLTIKDNGKGFDLHENMSGNGLLNMPQRAKEIGGNITIESKVGKGTKVKLVF